MMQQDRVAIYSLTSVTRLGFFESSRWQIFLQSRPNMWQHFESFFQNCHLKSKNCFGHFWVIFDKNWATFYCKIWSHWTYELLQKSFVALVPEVVEGGLEGPVRGRARVAGRETGHGPHV